jgi:hypothetical protein
MKYKNLIIGIIIASLLYLGSTYLYQGQEESSALYAKSHRIAKRHG